MFLFVYLTAPVFHIYKMPVLLSTEFISSCSKNWDQKDLPQKLDCISEGFQKANGSCVVNIKAIAHPTFSKTVQLLAFSGQFLNKLMRKVIWFETQLYAQKDAFYNIKVLILLHAINNCINYKPYWRQRLSNQAVTLWAFVLFCLVWFWFWCQQCLFNL